MMFSFAVLGLGLSAQEFWALSAAEWRALVETAAPQAMTSETLAALVKQYGGAHA